MKARLRNYCFTSFKDSIELAKKPPLRYCVYQRERCPDTGKEHFQGYIEFTKPMRLAAVKKYFGDKALHLEARRGSRSEARAYCMKEGSRISPPVEIGKWKLNQGARTDLAEVKASIDDGMDELGVAETYWSLWVRYYKAFNRYAWLKRRKLTKGYKKKSVVVLYGSTGTGKTKHVMLKYPDCYVLPMGDSQQVWFDGYSGEKVILLDDFYCQVKISWLLVLLDGYGTRLPVKGGFTWSCWDKVYITSNQSPDDWYPNVPGETKNALYRRITKVKELTL